MSCICEHRMGPAEHLPAMSEAPAVVFQGPHLVRRSAAVLAGQLAAGVIAIAGGHCDHRWTSLAQAVHETPLALVLQLALLCHECQRPSH